MKLWRFLKEDAHRTPETIIIIWCLLSVILLMRGLFRLFHMQVIILHFMDVGFITMGLLLVVGIVDHWLRVEKQPWIVWQGELRYSEFTRKMVALFLSFFAIVLSFFTRLFLLTPDIVDLTAKN